jgi:hypothetical protein
MEVRNVSLAEITQGELETVLLEDALRLFSRYGETDSHKYEAAAGATWRDG